YKDRRPRSAIDGKAAFPGYVFCRLDVTRRLPVLTTPGVMGLVSCGRLPLAIDADEISSLRLVAESLLPVEPHSYLNSGDPVKITSGPLAGAQGLFVKSERDHLVVSITLLQRSVCVTVESHWLEKTRLVAA
ncbi:MAG: hypothetical protein M3N54_08410, partial [Acidobacteriota bacterium]|nr:hypothetical protein [Acidobacteriota bacterium]